MKKGRTKTILMLTGTLVIGMVLGGLITAHHIRGRVNDMMEMRKRGGFRNHLVEIIKPTAEQKTQIEPVLEAFGERMEGMHKKHMTELHENFMLLRESLGAFLTDEQMQRVEKRLHRMQGRRKGPHGPHGPHGPPRDGKHRGGHGPPHGGHHWN